MCKLLLSVCIIVLLSGCTKTVIKTEYKQWDAPSTDMLTHTKALPPYAGAATAADIAAKRGRIEYEWVHKLEQWEQYYNTLKANGVVK